MGVHPAIIILQDYLASVFKPILRAVDQLNFFVFRILSNYFISMYLIVHRYKSPDQHTKLKHVAKISN